MTRPTTKIEVNFGTFGESVAPLSGADGAARRPYQL